jgi:uncharacterized protein YqfA (UPF0365 family)
VHALLLRSAPLLLTPLLLAVSTFPGEFRVPAGYWVLACAAAVVFVFGGVFGVRRRHESARRPVHPDPSGLVRAGGLC